MVIKKNALIKIYMLVIFVSLLEPRILHSHSIHSVFGIVRRVSLISSLFIFVKYKLFREIPILMLLAHVVWMGAATFFYSGTLTQGYIFMLTTLFATITSSVYCIRKWPGSFVLGIGFIFSLWILISGITAGELSLVLDERGSMSLFLGTKTTITYYVVPAMAFNFIAYHVVPKKHLFWAKLNSLMFAVGILLYLKVIPISTCIVCLAVGVVFAVLIPRFKRIARSVYRHGFWITSIVNFLFITGASMSLLTQFFDNALKEKEGLNGRTEIWQLVLKHVSDRPIVGHGYSSNIIFDAFSKFNTSTHNYFLHILFTTGIIGFGIYIIYILYIHKRNRTYIFHPIVGYLFGVLTIMNIEAISESYGFNVMTFLVLVLLGYANELVKASNSRGDNEITCA